MEKSVKETAPATRFGLLRHAPTTWNREKRIQGRRDILLTPEGEQLARVWGRKLKRLPWDFMVSSSSTRALKTAELMNQHLKIPMVADDRLREQDWGSWTGKTPERIRSEEPELLSRKVQSGWRFRPPGGESRNQVWERSSRLLADIIRDNGKRHILLVTHEGVIKCLIYRIRGRRFLPSEPELIRPFHLHWLTYERNEFKAQINALSLV